METKTCCICKDDLPVDQFKTNKAKKDGLQCQCIECQKKYRRQHYLENRQKYIDKAKVKSQEFATWWKEYKSQFKCQRCPEDHPACLHFHHPNDDKERGVAYWVICKSKEKVLKEIDKCVPLCANCHAKEHWKD